MSELQSLSLADLKALEAQIRAQKKAVEAQENARVASLLQEFVEDAITQGDPETSDKSTWVGYKSYGIPVTVDGNAYTVSVTITDVAGKAAREEAAKVAATA